MAKFCGNCGSPQDDNALVCGNCGAAFEVPAVPTATEATEVTENNSQNPMDKVLGTLKNNKNIVKYAIAGVAAVLVVILLIVAFSGGPEKTAKKYLKYTFAEKFDKVEKLYPDFILDAIEDQGGDVADQAENFFENRDDSFDAFLGSDFKVSYEILDVDIYDKDNEMYEDFIDMLEAQDYDEEAEKVKAIAIVTYEITAKDGKEFTTYEDTMTLVKYKGSWKMAE